MFYVSNPPTFEASFVLATLEEMESSQATQDSTVEKVRQSNNLTGTEQQISCENHTIQNDTSVNRSHSLSKPGCSGLSLDQRKEASSASFAAKNNIDISLLEQMEDNNGAVTADCVSASPPGKKVGISWNGLLVGVSMCSDSFIFQQKHEKAAFLGMFNSTVMPTVAYTSSQVLAPESDDEG